MKLEIKPLHFFVNGEEIIDAKPDPTESLIDYLRRKLQLTGTKLGCGEGGCGSCTVTVSSYEEKENTFVHRSVNACLAPVCSLDGKHVVTIEALGSAKNPHPIQEALATSHGSQCGFCTPGIIMSAYSLSLNNDGAIKDEVNASLDGNLCRCTGYRPIVEGFTKLLESAPKICSKSGNCENEGRCKDDHACDDIEDVVSKARSIWPQSSKTKVPELLRSKHEADKWPKSYMFSSAVKSTNAESGVKWAHPGSLSELLQIMDEYPSAKIVNGNTELGIEVRFKQLRSSVWIYASDLPELKRVEVKADGVSVGAGVTLTSLQHELKKVVSSIEEYASRGILAILDNLKYFAGTQIRNVAVLGGNIITASPISDLNPIWVALDVVAVVQSLKYGIRRIPMKDFFVGYRKTALQTSEVLISIFIPFTKQHEFAKAYKQAKRREDDIAIVNAAFRLTVDPSTLLISYASLVFGGMAPTTMRANSASDFLIGKRLSATLVNEVSEVLMKDMPMSFSTPGGQVEYRKALSISFFSKFVLFIQSQLSETSVAREERSAIEDIVRPPVTAAQTYQEPQDGSIVGQSVIHLSAMKQVTGEAQYLDDIPSYGSELHAAFVMSSQAHAKILLVDPSEALKVVGVKGYISAKDIPSWKEDLSVEDPHNPNIIGPTFRDEEVFATKEVVFVGQPIGLIVADSPATAQLASKLVQVKYEPLIPVLTIEDAIKAGSFFPYTKVLRSGAFAVGPEIISEQEAADVPLSAATRHVEGEMRIAGQEHFYLETNASLVVPKGEDDEYEVFASTQNPTETQHLVSHVLGVPANRIVCRVKRLGGGFGGKETRSCFLSCAVAVAAHKLKKPVRYALSREEDMILSGTRHPFLGKYRVGFTEEGRLVSLELELFANGGFSMDLSLAVVERAMSHSDNVYKIPHVSILGRVCKTNLATNTAFRGFGGPQGMMVAEAWINHVADSLERSVDEIRMLNFYKLNQLTHYRQPLDDLHFERVWSEVMTTSDFLTRKAAVEQYNRLNKFKKRGIIAMPTKFGIAFTFRTFNQAGALVHVYASDGSVLVTHGGTEMGQGLHTKMIQIAAAALGVPISKVHLSETSTATVPNTSPTAASISSDINGMAVKFACEEIASRLAPYRERNPEASWESIVKMAYLDRVNLSANGFYRVPDLTYDWTTNQGRMFSYFTYGAACTEVEIDTLTGDHVVLRTDIVMDIGTSINPAIDIGQIEGAFAQGQGWCTIEQPLISPNSGVVLTRGPGAYKIPGFRDVPADFRVNIVKGSRNIRAVHSSKAVGEPPLFLGASVFWAVKDAIKSARHDNGLKDWFKLDCPATSERIRIACGDWITKVVRTDPIGDEKPWSCES
ncbi:molybdopterin binding aldehyde oxidase/xanthine dehydrogenase [Cladochytrium replicatum]|nr:molybdopterin binding aldehyde oxidase/xanthine dehydrogenase [Cladochytrium replicatum]